MRWSTSRTVTSQFIETLCADILSSCDPKTFLFADGSKPADGTGAAFFVDDRTYGLARVSGNKTQHSLRQHVCPADTPKQHDIHKLRELMTDRI